MTPIKYDKQTVQVALSTSANGQSDELYAVESNYRVVGVCLINDADGLDASNAAILDTRLSIIAENGEPVLDRVPTQVVELGTGIAMDKRFMPINLKGGQNVTCRLHNETAVGADAGDEIQKTVVMKLMSEEAYQRLTNR